MRQVQELEGRVHWTSIKIEAQVHYFATILEHKVNTQILIYFTRDIPNFLVFNCDK